MSLGVGKGIEAVGNAIKGGFDLGSNIINAKNRPYEILSEVDKNQMAINAENARSSSFFIAGWRPMLAWICALYVALFSIVFPLVQFFAKPFFHFSLPDVDNGIIMLVLSSILGMATLRTYEKRKGIPSGLVRQRNKVNALNDEELLEEGEKWTR